MLDPSPGAGYLVSTHMLNSAATELNGDALAIAELRDAFNSACYTAESSFGEDSLTKSFNDFFAAWFAALDDQAETLGSTADATQQCAVIYDHAERTVLADIPAMTVPTPPAPPAAQGSPMSSLLNREA
jgi:hypothetical protein